MQLLDKTNLRIYTFYYPLLFPFNLLFFPRRFECVRTTSQNNVCAYAFLPVSEAASGPPPLIEVLLGFIAYKQIHGPETDVKHPNIIYIYS